MGFDVEAVVNGGAELGEGPVWDDASSRLLWLDILRGEVHGFDPAIGADAVIHRYKEPVAALVPGAPGTSVATIGRRVALLGGRDPQFLAELPTGDRGNDGACDPFGRYLVGTLTGDGTPHSCGLYRLTGPGRFSVVVEGVTLANGLDWSPRGDLLYFADTPTCKVDVFDYAPDGTASGRRTFVDLSDAQGRPDGLTVDGEGGIWVALVRAGQVRRYDPAGRLDAVVELPVADVTSCAFGGPDRTDLYVTSGCFRLDRAERAAAPLAGALFRVRPGVRGKAPYRFDPTSLRD